MTDFLQDIFIENACGTFAIPPCRSRIIEAMWLFGGYEMTMPIVVAILATLLGSMLSYVLGVGADVLRVRHSEKANIKYYAIARPYALKFLSPFILLYWVGPFTIISMLMGFFRMRWQIVALLTLCGVALKIVWLYNTLHAG